MPELLDSKYKTLELEVSALSSIPDTVPSCGINIRRTEYMELGHCIFNENGNVKRVSSPLEKSLELMLLKFNEDGAFSEQEG